MELVPHLDIIEQDRIETLLSDPANFVWRAVDCETLDTWSPDFGLTAYPRPSIYRPAAHAAAGISSTLRHRFWSTVEGQSDHTGSRYLGIVFYDAYGEESPMELYLADDEIGRVEPQRHDNRRHLIVVDRLVRFQGEMEVFRLTAPGCGTYRIEHFVLLHDRPEPSHFFPHISNLHVQTEPSASGGWQATVHFVTAQMATCILQVAGEAQPGSIRRFERPKCLHSLPITDLAPDCTYAVKLVVEDSSGAEESRSLTFTTTHRDTHPGSPAVIPIEIFNMASTALEAMPLTFGVPLPQGALVTGTRCDLRFGSYVHAAQFRIHARWPDGSARWALVDGVMPVALPAGIPQTGAVEFGSSKDTDAFRLTWQSTVEGIVVENARLRVELRSNRVHDWLRVELIDGEKRLLPLLPTASGRFLEFDAILGDDMTLTQSPIRELHVEQAGSHRVVLQFFINHVDAQGIAHLRSNMRLHIFAEQSFIKVASRLEIVSPALAPAGGGANGTTANRADFQRVIAGSQGEEAALLKLRRFALLLPLDDVKIVSTADEQWAIDAQPWRLVHEDDRFHQIGVEGKEELRHGRHLGQVYIDTASGMVAVALRRFWQTYPKGLKVASDGMHLELFPEYDEPMPGDEDAWHRLDYWRQEGIYLLKAGMALTNEILVDFARDVDATRMAFSWFEHPPVGRPTPAMLERSGALFPIAAKQESQLPDYEMLVEQAIDSFEADREHHRAYGQINFGDWYGESGWSWGNNEYDPAFCAYIEFLRGGVPRWATWGSE